MKNMKRMLCLALTVGTLMTAMPVRVSAASDYKYIVNVSLKVSIDLDSGDEVNNGDSLGVSSSDSGSRVYSSSSKYEAASAEWTNNRKVGIGDTPKITAQLEPNTSSSSAYEYRFHSSYSSNNVNISGGTFVSATKSGSDLKVVLRATGIKGTYEPSEDAEWGSSKERARWEAGENSSGYYDVYLYRGSLIVKKLEDYKGTSYNLYPCMTKEGNYSFKVRTVPHTDEEKKYGKKSEWTEAGDLYTDEDEVSDGSGQDNGGSTPSDGNTGVGWRKEGDYWYLRYPDGSLQKNGWLKRNDKWYLFDTSDRMLAGWQQADGYWYYMGESRDMRKGWIKSGNIWYYLNPNDSGPEGAMVKNCWLTINGKTYFMNENGAMVEGWYKVENNYYYFYPGDGPKTVNTSIDGFTLDANGVWQH